MSDPVLDIESQETYQVDELIEISHGTTVHRITTGTNDISYGGNLYLATAAARGEITTAGAGADGDLEITLPINHAFVRRFLQMLSPPKEVTVTLRRLYSTSVIEQAWSGVVAGVTVDDDGTEATFRCPATASLRLVNVIPGRVVSRTCDHTLYGTLCGVARTDTDPDGLTHQITATVLHVDGRDIRVDLQDPGRTGNSWAELGEVEHVTSGEVATVIKQTDANPGVSAVSVLSLQLPVPEIKIGDSVKISRGCARDILTCSRVFDNRQNFAGFNRLPSRNPHALANPWSNKVGEL